MRGTALAVVGLVALCGCAQGREAAVERAAEAFAEALRTGDNAAACAALAPRTREELESAQQQPCATALGAAGVLPAEQVLSAVRFGRQARVVVEDAGGREDTWFLSRSGSRWLVVASGCTPRGELLPYDCDVEGP